MAAKKDTKKTKQEAAQQVSEEILTAESAVEEAEPKAEEAAAKPKKAKKTSSKKKAESKAEEVKAEEAAAEENRAEAAAGEPAAEEAEPKAEEAAAKPKKARSSGKGKAEKSASGEKKSSSKKNAAKKAESQEEAPAEETAPAEAEGLAAETEPANEQKPAEAKKPAKKEKAAGEKKSGKKKKAASEGTAKKSARSDRDQEKEEEQQEGFDRFDEKEREDFARRYQDLIEFAHKKKNILEYQAVIDAFVDLKLEDEQYDQIISMLEENDIEVLKTTMDEDDDVDEEELEMIEDDEKDVRIEDFDLSIADNVNIEDHVRMYLKEIGKVPLLTADEEIELAKAMGKGNVAHRLTELGDEELLESVIRSGSAELSEEQKEKIAPYEFTDEDLDALAGSSREDLEDMMARGDAAKSKLAEANLRLVVSIAKRYVGRGMLFLDLIQEGNLGLIKAVEKFDYNKGFKFSTYATWWIRQAITRAIADQARTIRIPVHMVETINKLVRVSRQLLQKLGREPLPEEIAAEMDIPVERVREIIKISQEPVSLETPIGEEEDSHLGDFIQDENVPVPAEAAAFTLLKEQLQEVLGTLTEREQKVLRLRFGLDDGRARTLEEVGREFNVTRERIRQIEAKALRKLRHPSRSRKLKDYLD